MEEMELTPDSMAPESVTPEDMAPEVTSEERAQDVDLDSMML
jgi:hypothetical protein